ncbi:MAG: Gfo/Idh/MocA family oxidoreductase [Bacilli bacterium]|nr:Gfo/Idh/MocA family oxidoreductase [Bacilli bacterium]
MNKTITVSCIGVGQRGNIYMTEMLKLGKDKYKIVSLCDLKTERLELAKNNYGVLGSNLFTDEDEFFKEKRSDLLIVGTNDQDHVRLCLKGLKVGYDILCEKPISDKEDELKELLKVQQETGHKVVICHVLRYAPAFMTIKEYVDSGVIGQVVMIDDIENVGYSHQAHSYVRGNWRTTKEAAPMILAKCCHDLDLLVWLANSKCESISSLGDLRYFKKENQPVGASSRCKDCKYRGSCVFDAYELYIKQNFWGRVAVTDKRPITEEALRESLDNGPYGRCVFECDNDVVDNQITMMRFKNGITANLRMTAFTACGGRIMKIYGTYGQIDLDETRGVIELKPFGKEKTVTQISSLIDATNGHGGGDHGIVESLYDFLTKEQSKNISLLDVSIESHLMGIAAEKSRIHGGERIVINHDK